MSVRDQLEEALRAAIPATWVLIPYQDNLGALAKTTVMFKQLKLANLPEAPNGITVFSYVITIIEPGSDMKRVEAALDDHVEDLWRVLQGIGWTKPQEAQKVSFNDTNLAYDITTEILYGKES